MLNQNYVFDFEHIAFKLFLSIIWCAFFIDFTRRLKTKAKSLLWITVTSVFLSFLLTASLFYLSIASGLVSRPLAVFLYLFIPLLLNTMSTFLALLFLRDRLHTSGRYIFSCLSICMGILTGNYFGICLLTPEYLQIKPILVIMTIILALSTSFSLTRFLTQISLEKHKAIARKWGLYGASLGGISIGSIGFIVVVSIIHFEASRGIGTNKYQILIPYALAIMANLCLMLLPEFFGDRLVKKHSGSYLSLFKYNPNGVFWIDLEGNILDANDEACHMTGYTKEELTTATFWDLLDKSNDQETKLQYFNEVKEGSRKEIEARIIMKNGEEKDGVITTIRTIVNQELIGIYGIVRDVTESNANSKMIHFLAYYDELTKLPNRRLLNKKARKLMDHNEDFSFLYLNIDRFKRINDTFGHSYGDEILKQIANRLVQGLPADCIISRISGDEFGIISPDHYDSEAIAEQIFNLFSKPVMIEKVDFHMNVNIGIANYPFNTKDFEELIKFADIALNTGKKKSLNTYSFYKKGMIEDRLSRVELENDLRKAIERDEFSIYYQPKYNTFTGEIIGSEALARWYHPVYGFIPPPVFIKIAEELRLIVALERAIVHQVLKQIRTWKIQGFKIDRVSINISVIHFSQDDFVEFFLDALNQYHITGDEIGIEVTETIMMHDKKENNYLLQRLREMGIQISIDDFGTGFSSLSYLNQLAVDILKIDKSFIDEYESNYEIISAIISISNSLNLRVIAEGVETKEQIDFLQEVGCNEVQGYYYSKPVPPNELTAKLKLKAN